MECSKAWALRAVRRAACSVVKPATDKAESLDEFLPELDERCCNGKPAHEGGRVWREVWLCVFPAVVWQPGDSGPTDVVLFSQKQAKGAGTQDAQIQVQKCKLSIAGGTVQVRKDRFPRTERILTPVPGCM